VISSHDGIENFETPFLPAPAGVTFLLAATVTTSATRLGALVTLPNVAAANSPTGTRTKPRHVMLCVPSSAAQSVFVSLDNNTAPTTSLGIEIPAGSTFLITFDDYLLNAHAQTAIQLIAAASTAISVHFLD
jgi:hypothetical protein